MAVNPLITPCRRFLKDLAKEIGDEEFAVMKFLLSDKIGDGMLESLKKPINMFYQLLKMKIISDNNLNPLIELMDGIDRLDLAEKVSSFIKESSMPSSLVRQNTLPNFQDPSRHQALMETSQHQALMETRSLQDLTKTSLESSNIASPPSTCPANIEPNRGFQDSITPPDDVQRLLFTSASVDCESPGTSEQNTTNVKQVLNFDEAFNSDLNTLEINQESFSVIETKLKTVDISSNESHEVIDPDETSVMTPYPSEERNTHPKEIFTGNTISAAIDDDLDVDCSRSLVKTDPSIDSIKREQEPVNDLTETSSNGSDNLQTFESSPVTSENKNPPSIFKNLRSKLNQNDMAAPPPKLKPNFRPIQNQNDVRNNVILRSYQVELARSGLNGTNCIICAPTGSGKTLTAGFICQTRRLKALKENKTFKTLFIVNIRNLIQQQKEALELIVQNESASENCVCGIGESFLLSEYMERYDVTVLTAQILVNSLNNGDVKMSSIDLLILDECHHTNLKHPYNAIMLTYHKLKIEHPTSKLPQIIGLTASLGVGTSGDDQLGALSHYIRLCANLDCKSITHVKEQEHIEDLLLYNPRPQKDQIISVEPRPHENMFAKNIRTVIFEIEKMTMFPLATERFQYGTQKYENWVVNQRMTAEARDLKEVIVATEALQCLNLSLILLDELRAKDAFNHLENFFSVNYLTDEKNDTCLKICDLYDGIKQELKRFADEETLACNKKLEKLSVLLVDLFTSDPDARGILLTNTRSSVESLIKFINDIPQLKSCVAPAKLVGQGRKELTMTDVEQEAVLKRFRQGKDGVNGCNLLVATDVAQEGLDMPKCNFVIRYNFVSNEIGSVQSKGRARAPNSECYLIVNKESVNEKREYENLEKEHLMMQALEDIDQMPVDELQSCISQEQERMWQEYINKAQQKEILANYIDANTVSIHCKNCKAELCKGSDIRKRCSNFICIAEEQLNQKIFVKKLPRPHDFRFDLQIGMSHCIQSQCKKQLGPQLKYKQGKRTYGYALSKDSVMWKCNGDTEYRQIKKWSTVPFEIKEEEL